jgi:predicted RNA binding protein YcfA (HicA-like mRNA interferase family)
MGRLPRITGKQVVRALTKGGFVCKHIEGSHHIMQKAFPEGKVTIPVPVHSGKIIKLGLLNHILRKSRLSSNELIKLLK